MTRQEIKERAKAQLGNALFSNKWLYAVLIVFIVTALYSALSSMHAIGIVAVLIISGPLSTGCAQLFLKQARDNENMDIAGLVRPFSNDFKETFFLGLMVYIYTVLWSLLFIVPGIVKAYAYSMVFFIKVDHPEYTWRQCIDQSQIMMEGHKMDYFILQLSFIGWGIVGAFCLGVGTLWVSAYMEAANAHFYESIK